MQRLTEAMTAWSRGSHFGGEEFAERFFGGASDDLMLEQLHEAALDVVLATGHDELREATEKVAAFMQTIGLDRWPRVLAEARDRACDPQTVAAIERDRTPRDEDEELPNDPPGAPVANGVPGNAAPIGRAGGGGVFVQGRPVGAAASGVPTQGPKVPPNTLFSPAGKLVGSASASTVPELRTVSPSALRAINERILQGAVPTAKAGYPGRWYQRTDGSAFGIRSGQSGSQTIDVADPNLPSGLKVRQQ